MESVKSPFELAALASAAVPGLRVTELREPQYDDLLTSVTGLVDVEGNSWTVVASREETTPEDIARQARILSYLHARHAADDIPFEVPQLHGVAATGRSTYAYVYSDTGGRPLQDTQLRADGLLAASLGRALARLHNLSAEEMTALGADTATTDQVRQDLRESLAKAGREVPAALRKRWNIALDEDVLWSFDPVPIHGDLGPASILSEDGAVLSITGFRYLRPGDPSLDLAWILPLADEPFIVRMLQAYSQVRTTPDLHLMTRAQLHSELALLQWLQYGQAHSDEEIVTEAKEMLDELDSDLDGALLIASSKPVAEIRFTVDEEPLYRLKANATADSVSAVGVDGASGAAAPDGQKTEVLPPSPADAYEEPDFEAPKSEGLDTHPYSVSDMFDDER